MLAEIVQMELTVSEQTALAQCEDVIARGLRTFVDVGEALLTIRDRGLYRDYGTFEQYCRDRWGFVASRARQLIAAARIVSNVETVTNVTPGSEGQARPLMSLGPEQQREAWAWAVETAPEGKITGAHVRRVVDVYSGGTSRPHVTHNSGNNEWYTPPEYIEAARRVMGDIDLDPASSEAANETVQAATFYTIENDGLLYDWAGRVWLNPPYASHLIGLFADKLAEHVKRGDVTEACVLVNNATETVWFKALLDVASCVCFIWGRVKFIDAGGKASGAPLQGQALLYIGPNAEAFGLAFSDFGTVLYARAVQEKAGLCIWG